MKTKICNKCKSEFPESDEYFHKTKALKSGFVARCKKCVCESNKNWYEKIPDEKKKLWRDWGKKNPEKKKEINDNWKKNNPEKVKESNKRYYEKNIESISLRNAEYRKKDPDKTAFHQIKRRLKKQIGFEAPKEVIELKLTILKTKKLCRQLKN